MAHAAAGTPLYSDREVSEALPGGVGAPRASKGSCTSAPCPTWPWAVPDPVCISPGLSHCTGEQWPCPSPWHQPLLERGNRQVVGRGQRCSSRALHLGGQRGAQDSMGAGTHTDSGFGSERCPSRGVWGAGGAGCVVCWGLWVYGVMVWVLHSLAAACARCWLQRLFGDGNMGCGVMDVWGPMSVGCTGCMGVQGMVARKGPQQHSVALPSLWGHWGHRYSSRGADKSPVGSAGGWGMSSPSLSRTHGQTVTPGDGHNPWQTPCSPQHPNSS